LNRCCDGRLTGTGGCVIIALLLALLDCFESGIRIGRRLHGWRMSVLPVTYVRKIASKLLKQHDDLSGFRSASRSNLEFEMRAIFIDTR
jgi:hypothetical protein